MNRQPFYHRAVVLFTATEAVRECSLADALTVWARSKAARALGVLPDTLMIEEYEEPEAGDPADLM